MEQLKMNRRTSKANIQQKKKKNDALYLIRKISYV